MARCPCLVAVHCFKTANSNSCSSVHGRGQKKGYTFGMEIPFFSLGGGGGGGGACIIVGACHCSLVRTDCDRTRGGGHTKKGGGSPRPQAKQDPPDREFKVGIAAADSASQLCSFLPLPILCACLVGFNGQTQLLSPHDTISVAVRDGASYLEFKSENVYIPDAPYSRTCLST